MLKNVKISTKILTVMLATSLSALLIITLISYTVMLNLTTYSQDANIQLGITASEQSRQALLEQTEGYISKIVVEQAGNSNAVLYQVQTELAGLRDYMQEIYAKPSNFVGYDMPSPDDTEMGVACSKYILAPGVVHTPELDSELRTISNAEFMFSAVLENDPTLDNTYLGTETGISYRYSRSNLYNEGYDPRERGWYTAAMASPGEVVWVDTYLDPYGSICVTCCATFADASGRPIGVVATDITLKNMQESIVSTRIGDGGYAFLLDNKAAFIVHPDYQEEGFNTEPLTTATGDWRKTLEAMAAGENGVSLANINGEDYYVAYAPLECTGWSLGVTVPIKTVVAPADETKAEIDAYTETTQDYIRETLSSVLMRFIILFALCTMLFVVFSFILSGTITKPLKNLVQRVHKMGGGDLDTLIEVKSHDEVGELASSFNSMARDLKAYINDLSVVVAEKERIGTELSVAANIQNDMLPHIFPTFSDLPHLAMYAKMIPAKAVGGDFYDCFFLDSEKKRMCALIADVSGKGVPASLFMVIAKTLIKTNMLSCSDPAKAINRANSLLCEDNSSMMFVTAFISVIDTETREITYVNCGHNPPLIGSSEKGFRYLTPKRSLPLAIVDSDDYSCEKISIEPGETLYLYTDGITEASNEAGDLFGEKALLDTLNSAGTTDPEALDNAVREAAAGFVAGAEQADDMTTLAITFMA